MRHIHLYLGILLLFLSLSPVYNNANAQAGGCGQGSCPAGQGYCSCQGPCGAWGGFCYNPNGASGGCDASCAPAATNTPVPPAPTNTPAGGGGGGGGGGGTYCGVSCTIANGGPSGGCAAGQYLYVQTQGYTGGQCGTSCLLCPAGSTSAGNACGCTAIPTPTQAPVACQANNCDVASCGGCNVQCGSGSQTCQLTGSSGGTACVAGSPYSQACTGAEGNCQATQACISGTCINLVTLSGVVFNDPNKNQVKDGSEANFSAGTSTIRLVNLSSGASTTYNTANGAYTSGQTIVPGGYRVEYTSLPTGWNMSYPLNGPPPSFNVVLGAGCNTGGSNSASCTPTTMSNLNFGISNSIPWFQLVGGSARFDSGLTNKIPSTAIGGVCAAP